MDKILNNINDYIYLIKGHRKSDINTFDDLCNGKEKVFTVIDKDFNNVDIEDNLKDYLQIIDLPIIYIEIDYWQDCFDDSPYRDEVEEFNWDTIPTTAKVVSIKEFLLSAKRKLKENYDYESFRESSIEGAIYKGLYYPRELEKLFDSQLSFNNVLKHFIDKDKLRKAEEVRKITSPREFKLEIYDGYDDSWKDLLFEGESIESDVTHYGYLGDPLEDEEDLNFIKNILVKEFNFREGIDTLIIKEMYDLDEIDAY